MILKEVNSWDNNKSLHESIGGQEILIDPVVEEVGEARIFSQRIKVFINPGFSQEIITRPFTRPYFRYARKIILGLFLLFSFFILGALARRAPQKSPYHFLKISEIFSNFKIKVNQTKQD